MSERIRWKNKYFEVHEDYIAVHMGDLDVYIIKDRETGLFIEREPGVTWYDGMESAAIGYAEELTEHKIFEKIMLSNE